MRYTKLGKTDIDVSVLSLGCWSFAGGFFWGEQAESDSIATIHAALDLGVNFLDTAEGYENGASERVVGKALKHRRDKAVIATKVSNRDHFHTDAMIAACEQSLKNLDTDYIDLYYLHWPMMDIPFDEAMEALSRLKQQGKIRAGGICNYGLKQMRMLKDTGRFDLLEAHQLPYNLLWRSIEYGIQQASIDAGLGIVCYSTLAQGLLSGRYGKVEDVPDYLRITRFYKDPDGTGHGGEGCEAEVFDAIGKLKALCKEENLTLAEASLAWLYKQKGVASLLTGPRNVEELMQNTRCLDVTVSDELAARMTALSEPVKAKIGGNPDMWNSGVKSRTF